jgi:hypothetical protein
MAHSHAGERKKEPERTRPLFGDLRDFYQATCIRMAFDVLSIEVSEGKMTPAAAWAEMAEAYEAATGFSPMTINDLSDALRAEIEASEREQKERGN